jgi:hypothetical protein
MSRPVVLVPLERLLTRGYTVERRLRDRIAGEARVEAHLRCGRLALLVEDAGDWVVIAKRAPR